MRPAEIIRGVAVSFLNDSMPGELGIDVQIAPSAEQLCVNADRQLFVRVFRNLINNSVKHSGKSGSVEIRISMWQEKKKCDIRLEDNGVGYSEEVLRRLRSRKKDSPGENIRGLEIVKKIIWRMAGNPIRERRGGRGILHDCASKVLIFSHKNFAELGILRNSSISPANDRLMLRSDHIIDHNQRRVR